MSAPTMLDLFSGIGGFSLAGRWAGFETVAFCEIDPFCQAVLRKHWPEVPIHADVTDLDGAAYRGVALVTGGFPCQPVSNAGRRQGDADARWLWPALRRVVAAARPRWVVAENVRGLLSLGHEEVCLDLEAEGYQVGTLVLPAVGVDAPHRRERVWIVAADAEQERRRGFADAAAGDDADGSTPRRQEGANRSQQLREDVADAQRVEGGERRDSHQVRGWTEDAEQTGLGSRGRFVADSDESRRRASERDVLPRRVEPDALGGGAAWLDWDGRSFDASIWAVEPNVGRVADGVPRRVDRLRSLGNAIVPQVSYHILSAIAQYEHESHA